MGKSCLIAAFFIFKVAKMQLFFYFCRYTKIYIMELKIKKIRKEKKIKLIDLCRLTGLAKSTLWRLETGKTTPNMDTLIKIKDALNVELTELI